MAHKPEFVKINIKEINNQLDPQLNEGLSQTPNQNVSKDVKAKVASHVQSRKSAGTNFDRRTQTAYLKNSDFFSK